MVKPNGKILSSILSICLAVTVWSCAGCAAASSPAKKKEKPKLEKPKGPKNESGLRVAGPSNSAFWYDDKDNNFIQICKGQTGAIEKIADLTASQIREGVNCVVADFDRNGFLDFVLYGSPPGYNFTALLYEGKSLLKMQALGRYSELLVFPTQNGKREDYPEFKDSMGLIEPGQGDAGHILMFNQDKNLFQEIPYVYPPGYD